MAVTCRGSFQLVLAAAVACGCLQVVAAEPPAANPAVEPPKPVAAAAAASPTVTQAMQRLRTIHRQVSRLPLHRTYRVVPLGDAATVAAHEKIDAALLRPLEEQMTFEEAPFREVVGAFRERLGVPVVVDRKAFEDAGLDLDNTVITFTSHGTTARAALRQILDDLDLTWTIRDESLLITTKEAVAEMLEVRLYPLPLSVCMQPVADLTSLFDLVQNTVAPQTWNTVGGEGAIQSFGDGAATGLVVRQTIPVHDEVEGLLRGLHEREFAEFDGAPAGNGLATVRVYQVADEATRDDLARKLVQLCNEALPQGRDLNACVTIVGGSLAVHAATPEFHALAGQLIRAVAGEQVLEFGGWNPAGAAGMGGPF